jgi:hypothetical protein
MANTFGHSMRRYLGHKLYLASNAARKARFAVDHGIEEDLPPFWADAPEPTDHDDQGPDWGEIAYQDEMADHRAHERALLASVLACTCTEDMRASFACCNWCELASAYSDTYKDRNGIRPRHFANWTGLDFDRALQRLYAQPFHD